MNFRLYVSLASLALLTSACDCNPPPPAEMCENDGECAADERCQDGRCAPRVEVDAGEEPGMDAGPLPDAFVSSVTSLRIEPADVTLTSVNGSMPAQDFDAFYVFDDGSERAADDAIFEILPLALGDIGGGDGNFVANGILGGTATVSASGTGFGGGWAATATVTVQLEHQVLGDGVPADVADRFATPVTDDARRAQLVYPLDGSVMPQNVYPADVQWLLGGAADLFRVRLTKPNITVEAFLADDGTLGNHWLADETAWRSLTQTDPDSPATITVDRWESTSGEAIAGVPVEVTFARAALTGSVYYWDIARGRIVRIDDGTATRDEFMPTPPLANNNTDRCVGCHAVSPSGRYMAGRLGGGENIGAIFDLTEDLSVDPPPVAFPLVRGGLTQTHTTSIRWWFSSWSPDETHMVATTHEGGGVITRPDGSTLPRWQLVFYDPLAGTEFATTGAVPAGTHPAWSPDGTQVAYVANNNDWGGTNTTGDIAVLDVSGSDPVVMGANTVVHPGADLAANPEGGVADSYPSWSPDSSLIAFGHGTGSRSEDQACALYLMNRDGTNVVALETGSEGTNNFQPRFSPFTQGGYYWLSFLSRRDYGNTVTDVGTRGDNRQQIWVMAISTDAAAGVDPSSAPYWLPGQSTESRNISAYWAPRPCRPNGESCAVGSECCGGDCRPDADGALVCTPPPPDRCRVRNETCADSADCCEGLTCLSNVCVTPLD